MFKFKILWLVLLDQGLKQWIFSNGGFQLNQGIAFGLGSHAQWFWLFLTLGLLIWLGFKFKFNFSSSLIISGGVSNLIDRILRGGIVDYIFLPYLPVFNLSDCLIVAGCLGLLYSLVYGTKDNI